MTRALLDPDHPIATWIYLYDLNVSNPMPTNRIVECAKMKLHKLHTQRILFRILALMKRNIIEANFAR